jgi:hypothetical protein
MRLRNTLTGVQINIPADKADRLVANGTYKALPDAEQPPKQPSEHPKQVAKPKGKTDIAAAIAQGAPHR